jgi:hypothetical protein
MMPDPVALTIEDVQRIVGRLVLELELLRRENAMLRAELTPPVLESDGRR